MSTSEIKNSDKHGSNNDNINFKSISTKTFQQTNKADKQNFINNGLDKQTNIFNRENQSKNILTNDHKKHSNIIPLITENIQRKDFQDSNNFNKINPSNNSEASNLPLILQNRIPGLNSKITEEEKLKHDLSLRPNPPRFSSNEYQKMPIENFGIAMLKGMGQKEGGKVGKSNARLVKPIEITKPRPPRQGLGANILDLEKMPKLTGKHRKQSNFSNKLKENIFNEKIILSKTNSSQSERRKRNLKITSSENQLLNKKQKPSSIKALLTQIVPNIRVRIISKSYMDGKYYKCKGRVDDVPSPNQFVLILDNSNIIINDLDETQVETLVPRNSERKVMFVGISKYSGRFGIVIEKNSSKNKARVNILEALDDSTVLEEVEISLDEICEYVN